MSGIEVVGIVLGAIPLFISAAEHTRGTIKVFKLAKHMPDRLDDFADDLRFQDWFLRKLLGSILEEANDSRQIDEIDWSDIDSSLEVRSGLERVLGSSFPLFCSTLQRSQRLFEKQINKHLAHGGQFATLQTVVEDAKLGNYSVWERVKFVWREEERNEALAELQRCNDRLSKIRSFMTVNIIPSVAEPTTAPPPSAESIYSVGKDAQRLHDALLEHSDCTCRDQHPPHHAALRLKQSAEDGNHFITYLSHKPDWAYAVQVDVAQVSRVQIRLPDEIQYTDSLENLCAIMCDASKTAPCVHLRLSNESLYHGSPVKPTEGKVVQHVPAPGTWSLRQFLDRRPKPCLRLRRQTAALATTLAYATLQLYDSQWMNACWSTGNIVFVRDASSWTQGVRRFDLFDPCVASTLDLDSLDEMPSDLITEKINASSHGQKHVLALGIALLELFLGQSFHSACVEAPGRDIKHVAEDMYEENVDSFDDDDVYAAIGWCLTLQPPAPHRQRGFHRPKFREHYYDNNHVSLIKLLACDSPSVMATSDGDGAAIANSATYGLQSFKALLNSKLTPAESEAATDEFEQFHYWSKSIGALSGGHASLDYRLRDDKMTRDLILSILHNITRTLQSCLSLKHASEEDSYKETFTSVISSGERLMRLLTLIRGSKSSNRIAKGARYEEKDEDGHPISALKDEILQKMLQRDYPDLPEGLRHRLEINLSQRRREFAYNRKHQAKLAYGISEMPRLSPVPPVRSVVRAGPTPNIEGAPLRSLAIAKLNAPTETSASSYRGIPVPSAPKSSVTSGSRRSQQLKMKDLPAPLLDPSKKYFECPCCCISLPMKESRGKYWSKHLLNDLRPFVCIYDVCETSAAFATSEQWIAHMSSEHSTEWCCDGYVHPPLTFNSAESYQAHLKAEHIDRYESDQLQKITARAQIQRDEVVENCPFCDFQPDGHTRIIDIDDDDERFDLLERLEQLRQDHVRSHLISLFSYAFPEELEYDELPSSGAKTLGSANSYQVANLGDDSVADDSMEARAQTVDPDITESNEDWNWEWMPEKYPGTDVKDDPVLENLRASQKFESEHTQDPDYRGDIETGDSFDQQAFMTSLKWLHTSSAWKKWENETDTSIMWITDATDAQTSALYNAIMDRQQEIGKTFPRPSCGYKFHGGDEGRLDGAEAAMRLIRRASRREIDIRVPTADERPKEFHGMTVKYDEPVFNPLTVCILSGLDVCREESCRRLLNWLSQKCPDTSDDREITYPVKILILTNSLPYIEDHIRHLRPMSYRIHAEFTSRVSISTSAQAYDVPLYMSEEQLQSRFREIEPSGQSLERVNDKLVMTWENTRVRDDQPKRPLEPSHIIPVYAEYVIRQWDEALLSVVPESKKSFVLAIYGFMIAARRLLNEEEILTACMLLQSYRQNTDSFDGYLVPDLYYSWFRDTPLIESVNEKFRFISPSATGFLSRRDGEPRDSQTWYGSVAVEDAHNGLAGVSMMVAGETGLYCPVTLKLKLQEYTQEFWITHYKYGSTTSQETLLHAAIGALAARWVPRRDEKSQRYIRSNTPLALSIYFDMTYVTENILEDYRRRAPGKTPRLSNLSDIALGHLKERDLNLSEGLVAAAYTGRANLVSEIIKLGANVNKHVVGITALQAAAASGELGIIVLLISSGADAKLETDEGSALAIALSHNERDCAIYLIGQDADAKLDSRSRASILELAIAHDNEDVVDLLLKRDSARSTASYDVLAALFSACSRNNIRIVEIILNYSPSINARHPTLGSVFHTACRSSSSEIVKLLILNGAIIDLYPQEGTDLQSACIRGDIDVVRVLLRNGSNVNAIRPSDSTTALHLACEFGNRQLVRLLLDYGANPNVTDDDKMTPLHLACAKEDAGMVVELLSARADANLRTSAAESALDIACQRGSLEIVNQLVNHGADIGSTYTAGQRNLVPREFPFQIADRLLQVPPPGDSPERTRDRRAIFRLLQDLGAAGSKPPFRSRSL